MQREREGERGERRERSDRSEEKRRDGKRDNMHRETLFSFSLLIPLVSWTLARGSLLRWECSREAISHRREHQPMREKRIREASEKRSGRGEKLTQAEENQKRGGKRNG